jgi:hypothetical protein
MASITTQFCCSICRRRIKVEDPSEFKDAMLQIKLFLGPVFEAICDEKEFFLHWISGSNQWM